MEHVILIQDVSSELSSELNRSHAKKNGYQEIVASLIEKVLCQGELNYSSVKERLDLIDDLTKSSFTRFILEAGGLDGPRTDYLMTHPEHGKISGLNSDGIPFSFTEDFILNRSIITLATRERFLIFQKQIQSRLKEGITMASIPCGAMRDLLGLDYRELSNFKLLGIDLDQNSLSAAAMLAQEKDLLHCVELRQGDAWNLGIQGELDLITSNGLNIYEPRPEKVLDLYREFYAALKPGGVLIIGVLSHPPDSSSETDWNLDIIPREDLRLEKVLYADILGLKWRNFRSFAEAERDFISVGFSHVTCIYDSFRAFPTFIVQK